MKQKTNKRIIISFVTVFLSVCIVLGLYTLIRPAREFSVRENRKLASFPKFSFSALADGSFTKDLSTYFNDQFAGRDMWTGLNLTVKKAITLKATIRHLAVKKYYVRIRTYKTIAQVHYFSTWSRIYQVKTK